MKGKLSSILFAAVGIWLLSGAHASAQTAILDEPAQKAVLSFWKTLPKLGEKVTDGLALLGTGGSDAEVEKNIAETNDAIVEVGTEAIKEAGSSGMAGKIFSSMKEGAGFAKKALKGNYVGVFIDYAVKKAEPLLGELTQPLGAASKYGTAELKKIAAAGMEEGVRSLRDEYGGMQDKVRKAIAKAGDPLSVAGSEDAALAAVWAMDARHAATSPFDSDVKDLEAHKGGDKSKALNAQIADSAERDEMIASCGSLDSNGPYTSFDAIISKWKKRADSGPYTDRVKTLKEDRMKRDAEAYAKAFESDDASAEAKLDLFQEYVKAYPDGLQVKNARREIVRLTSLIKKRAEDARIAEKKRKAEEEKRKADEAAAEAKRQKEYVEQLTLRFQREWKAINDLDASSASLTDKWLQWQQFYITWETLIQDCEYLRIARAKSLEYATAQRAKESEEYQAAQEQKREEDRRRVNSFISGVNSLTNAINSASGRGSTSYSMGSSGGSSPSGAGNASGGGAESLCRTGLGIWEEIHNEYEGKSAQDQIQALERLKAHLRSCSECRYTDATLQKLDSAIRQYQNGG